MRRVLLISACCSCWRSPGRRRGGARRSCSRATHALEPQQRAATFEARVRRAYGSERMQVRFTLQVRERGAARLAPRGRRGLRQVADVRPRRAPLLLRQDRARTSPRRPPTARSCASAGSTPTGAVLARSRRDVARSAASPTCGPTSPPRGSTSRRGPSTGAAPLRGDAAQPRPHGGRRRSRSRCAPASRRSSRSTLPGLAAGEQPVADVRRPGLRRGHAADRDGRPGPRGRRARRGRQRARRRLPAVVPPGASA